MVAKHTFHDIHQWPHISFDDAAVFAVLHWVHTIHNLLDLRQLQVLHKVIVKDGLLYEILGLVVRERRFTGATDKCFQFVRLSRARECRAYYKGIFLLGIQ